MRKILARTSALLTIAALLMIGAAPADEIPETAKFEEVYVEETFIEETTVEEQIVKKETADEVVTEELPASTAEEAPTPSAEETDESPVSEASAPSDNEEFEKSEGSQELEPTDVADEQPVIEDESEHIFEDDVPEIAEDDMPEIVPEEPQAAQDALLTLLLGEEPELLVLNAETITLGVGESFTLEASEPVTWKSSKSSIAKVTDGTVKGVKAGQATMTAVAADGRTRQCVVTVKAAPKSVKFTKKTAELPIGGSFRFEARPSSGSASKLTWSSSDASVATIDADGTLHALAEGSVTVTVSTYVKKVSASCKLLIKPVPTGVALDLPEIIGTGDSVPLNARLIPENAYGTIEIRSSDPNVAAVAKDRLIAGYTGFATLSLWSSFDPSVHGEYDIEVLQGVEAIELNTKKITLGRGEIFDLIASSAECTVDSKFVFKSSSNAVAAIDEKSGHIIAKKAGKATMTVTAHNGKKASCLVTVKKAPSKVKLTEKNLLCPADENYSHTFKAKLPSGTASLLTWSSSDPEVATIEAGALHPLKSGETTVTVTTFNGHSASCAVTVQPVPEMLIVKDVPAYMYVGQTVTADVGFYPEGSYGGYEALVFGYDDAAPVKVTKNKVKATTPGSAQIWFYSDYNAEAIGRTEVTVEAAPSGLKLDLGSVALGCGEQIQLTATSTQGEHIDPGYTFSSNKKSVATVDENGLVTAQNKAGTATITVRTCNGKTAKCKVTVKKLPSSIKMEKTEMTLGVGMSATLKTVLSKNSATREIAWSSDNDAVATVEGGTVTAIAEGTARISARTGNGKVTPVPCAVTVVPAPKAVYAPLTLTIKKGKYKIPVIRFDEGAMGSYTLTSSDESIVKVSGTKLVAKKRGKALITVRVDNGDVNPANAFYVTVN